MDEEEIRKQEYLAYREEYYKNYLLVDRGRMKRLEFFISVFLLNALSRLFMKLETQVNEQLMFIGYLVILYAAINFILKRVRDIGISPWWALFPAVFGIVIGTLREMALSGQRVDHLISDDAVPVVLLAGVVFLLLPLYFWPSQKRDNKYGKFYPYGAYSSYKPAKKAKMPKEKSQKRRAV